MKIKVWLFAGFLLAACGDQRSSMKMESAAPAEGFQVRSIAAFDAVQEKESQPASLPVAQADRKLIKDGSLNFKTRDLEKTKKEVGEVCKTLDAYLSNENLSNFDDRISYQQTIRVPADQFEALIEQLEKLADKVENKNVHSRDVTEEFIDVETRLKNKTQLETRYRELLAQARTVEDMLSIERELGNVRQEIESTEGRLKYLKNQVAFSTLELSYYQVVGTDFGFASKFVDSLADGWDNMLAFVIWLLSLWPFLILLGAIGWLVRKYWRRKVS